MLVEIREEGYKILSKRVPSQYAEINKDGKEYGVSVEALPYCLADVEENIYLGVNYVLEDNREALKNYKDVLEVFHYKDEDILVLVRYVVYQMKLIEEVHYKSVLTGRNLPIRKLNDLIKELRELDYTGAMYSNRMVQELMYMDSVGEYEPDRREYSKKGSYVEYISEESKKENKVKVSEDLFKGTIQKVLQPGEGIYTEELTTGELYVKMAHRVPEKIPTKDKAILKKLDKNFRKSTVAVRLMETYPEVDGYKFYHKDKQVYIALYEGEKELGERKDIVFGMVQALFEKYTLK